jgi:hypothetical protein
VSTPEALIWGGITAAVTAGLAYAGVRQMKRARLVERTPTTSAASLEGGEVVEVKGRVVAAEQTLETPLSRRSAVWFHVEVKEAQGSSSRTLVDQVRAVDFLIDDGSGRMARVVPRAHEKAVVALDADRQWENETDGLRKWVLELLRAKGHEDFEPTKLSWTERALFAGDPVYVLGHAEPVVGPPVADGYRSVPSSQLVLRGTADAPLTIAAMTEEQFVAELKSRAGMYFGCATAVAVLGLVASLVALMSDCSSGD